MFHDTLVPFAERQKIIMKLVPIPVKDYEDYKRTLMFEGYKWDPQFLDNNTVAKYVLVLTEEEAKKLEDYTEKLDKETRAAEEFLNGNLQCAKKLKLPKKLKKDIKAMKNYKPGEHIRLTRYDFHPVAANKLEEIDFAVSEVNSDVPGGFAEASVMPYIAREFLDNQNIKNRREVDSANENSANGKHANENRVNKNYTNKNHELVQEKKYTFKDFGAMLTAAIINKLGRGTELNINKEKEIEPIEIEKKAIEETAAFSQNKLGTIFLNHCTCYSDDRQVMEFLADRLKAQGFKVLIGAADHINFQDNKAYSILDGNKCELDAIFRYTPVEWLMDIKPKKWQGYFDTKTPSCNHPVSLFAQTKRFPFVWGDLEQSGISMDMWRKLLPKTVETKEVLNGKCDDREYIYKPAYGRVGEKISIKEACKEDEYKKILKDVKRHPKKYIAQEKFESVPIKVANGEEYHVCIGSYAVEGKHAGFYARISDRPRIDSNAADIPVLVECINGEIGNKEISGKEISDKEIGNKEIRNIEIVNNERATTEQYKIPEKNLLARQAYSQWAPEGKKWTDWVRPVPFINIGKGIKRYRVCSEDMVSHLFSEEEKELEPFKSNTSLVVDMSGPQSVMLGLHLAREGFRPIPIYNGTIEQENARATTDNQSVTEALLMGCQILKDIKIDDEALPVFLLDSNRLNRYKRNIGIFDNSWDVYPQDMPSAEYFLKNGIDKILVVGEKLSRDLRKILYNYQRKNIQIYFKKMYDASVRVKVRKPIGKK